MLLLNNYLVFLLEVLRSRQLAKGNKHRREPFFGSKSVPYITSAVAISLLCISYDSNLLSSDSHKIGSVFPTLIISNNGPRYCSMETISNKSSKNNTRNMSISRDILEISELT
eukprot:snap_masked-scaffold_5-processed-gene-9.14-mRNA-1 protein AED:1.00 eAED:1.00 QI:0/0/0/0/1/1/2/0/112